MLAVNRHLRGTFLVGEIMLPMLGLVYLILRSLWFRIPSPEGLRLKRLIRQSCSTKWITSSGPWSFPRYTKFC